jgi:hypothetical protein
MRLLLIVAALQTPLQNANLLARDASKKCIRLGARGARSTYWISANQYLSVSRPHLMSFPKTIPERFPPALSGTYTAGQKQSPKKKSGTDTRSQDVRSLEINV